MMLEHNGMDIKIYRDEINTNDPIKKEAMGLIELQAQLDKLEAEVKERKEKIKEAMEMMQISKIEFFTGNSIVYVNRRNVKVDKRKALVFLDSKGITDDFMKLDETKLKEVYFDKDKNDEYDFFKEEISAHIQIR